jgi:Ribosomal L27 protein
MLSWKSLVSTTTVNLGHGCRWGKAVTTVIPMSEQLWPPSSPNGSHSNHYSLMQCFLGGVRGAKKKAGGSSTNGRESAGRRLGIKVWPNTFASEYFVFHNKSNVGGTKKCVSSLDAMR